MSKAEHSARAKITVVMPAYNAAELMADVLTPLLQMHEAGEIDQILVIDDRSTDTTAARARELGAEVIIAERNGGPGAARNLAARHADGEILWFVDSDVIADPAGPALIRKAFTSPDVVAVFGSYDDAPRGTSWISQYKNLVHRYYHQRAPSEASTFWAGCGAVRKSAFLEIGGFDVETFTQPSIEDIDLGYRLRHNGGRILLLPDLLGKHLKVWTFSSVLRTDIFMRALPWSRLLITREGLSDDLNISVAERFRAGLALLLLLGLLMLPFYPAAWPAVCAIFILCILANASLYRFMKANGGFAFAIFAVSFHQIYYIYSSVAFVYCLFEAKFISPRSAQ
nr:glycosyltransferase [Salipiger sp. PrR002]